jgi:hypothetical protein
LNGEDARSQYCVLFGQMLSIYLYHDGLIDAIPAWPGIEKAADRVGKGISIAYLDLHEPLHLQQGQRDMQSKGATHDSFG